MGTSDLRIPRLPQAADATRTDSPPAAAVFLRLRVLPPLTVYAASLLGHLLILAQLLPAGGGETVTGQLTAWDAQLYLQIARFGYPHGFTYTPDGQLTGNNLAFFPLYPQTIRIVHTVTGADWTSSAVVASQAAMIAAMFLVHALIRRLYGPRTAVVLLVLLAAAQPMSGAFFMAYSEPLFLATCTATLYAAHRRNWLLAGLAAFAAGMTRPAGCAAVAALAVAAVLEARRHGFSWKPIVATLAACTSTPLYLLWVGNRVGTLNAWFTIQQAGWSTHWDWGTSFWQFLTWSLPTSGDWVPVSVAVMLVAALAATAVTLLPSSRTWPPLLMYGVLIVALTIGQSNYFQCKPRLLAPAILFLVPAATALARARGSVQIITLIGAALFGCWYSAYMLTTWQYAV